MGKVKSTIEESCSVCGIEVFLENLEEGICYQCTCEHDGAEYQPEEKENNVPESYTCNECGTDLPIPEPDWDALAKEKYL